LNARASRRDRTRTGARLTPENRRIIGLVLVTGLVAFVIGFGLTALIFRSGAAPAEVVMVPDIRERTVAQARTILENVDLSLTVGDSLPNPNVPAGAILAQTPLPGHEVAPGATVRVILSSGSPRPVVPDVDAMPVTLATRALQAAGFEVVIDEGEGPLGAVLRTDPAPGTPLPLPATVRLIVGRGATLVAVPDVVGLPEEEAMQAILDAGLEVGEVSYGEGDTGEPGDVFEQTPSPGGQMPVGTRVDLRVNLPRVIG
jgi:eukaryotic-like serine/threonine-protein kinase